MAKVRAIASTISYGSNGFKHLGDVFNLPDSQAKEKEALGLVQILPDEKEDKTGKETKELKSEVKTK
ncbi:hypothetical protein [Pedobacter cryoconitis]|uniref:Uncharacterized protein n=1 Tax=Pedobacter cryoconitis TaxID=188932 RepID=A0A327SMW9_9SPHI|nr:hypothetical protein [Pedobacter cryoconitis]RAJ28873.1 hypothetical protein LY11_03147 [Pedobacter cryoconitis]